MSVFVRFRGASLPDNVAKPLRQRLIGHGPMCPAVAPPGLPAKVSVNGNSSSAGTGRGKTVLMNDDTRLRDGLAPREGSPGLAAAAV
ncbi:MAG TPA: hypothetical protein VGO01_17945, partial [Bradyrhizobium sp.]|nr:hypothetical protein [Bradyrhizobium sp.]